MLYQQTFHKTKQVRNLSKARYNGEKLIRIEVEVDLKKKFKAICTARGTSMNALLGKMIKQWVSEHEDFLDNSEQSVSEHEDFLDNSEQDGK